MANIFVERLWRRLKCEEVYLNAYASVAETKAISAFGSTSIREERQDQSLTIALRDRFTITTCGRGRSTSPTRSAFQLGKRGNACLRRNTFGHHSQQRS